jgi:hypothetical protein
MFDAAARIEMPDSHDFRRIALSFPAALESSHMNHPDFRVGGKIFAALPSAGRGMVQLLPEQQENYRILSGAFTPAAGAWGRGGSTLVELAEVPDDLLEAALAAAWQRRAPPGAQQG